MQRPAQWWQSALVRWHVRHVAMIWVGVRMLVTLALALSAAFAPEGMAAASPMRMVVSPSATLVSIILVMLVSEIDRRRIGSPLLFANLGYSARWSVTTTGALAIGFEALLQVTLRVSGGD